MIDSGYIQVFPETLSNIQDTIRGHSSNINNTFELHSDYIHDIFREIQELTENFQIFKTHSGDLKVTCMIY